MDGSENDPRMGAAQERDLVRRAQAGNRDAAGKLIAAQRGLVVSIAKRYAKPGGASLDDLCQQGDLGLFAALAKYDPAGPARLGSFAYKWIEGEIKKALGPELNEELGLQADELAAVESGAEGDERLEDGDEHGGEDVLTDPHRRRAPRSALLGEFVGGQESGRDPYLGHTKAEFAKAKELLIGWLADEGDTEAIDEKTWDYFVGYERPLLARVEGGEQQALTEISQKYGGLKPERRSHETSRLTIGPDKRSHALARIVAHAVEVGTPQEQAFVAGWPRGAEDMPPSPQGEVQSAAPAYRPGFAEVQEFRDRFLGGELIAAEQIPGWIAAQLEREGAPAVAYVRVALQQEDVPTFGELPLGRSVQAYATWLAREFERVRSDPDRELPGGHPDSPQALCYCAPGMRLEIVRIRSDGVLAELKAVADNLRAHFDGWLEEEAVAFILSGAIPPLDKLRAHTRKGLYAAASRILLDVDPRTSSKEVAAFYNRLRMRWVAGRDRPMSDKHLALAIFTDDTWSSGLTWPELYERWNAEHPQGDALHSAVGAKQFAVECRDAWERVTGEAWPNSRKAARRLADAVAAARARRAARQQQT
jgi:RNA polymerase sigma factor (sigma-70 family)